MIILLKNKHTLKFDDFYFKCSIGKNGTSLDKLEKNFSNWFRSHGGFSSMRFSSLEEINKSINNKFEMIRLGDNRLRTETACIASLSIMKLL